MVGVNHKCLAVIVLYSLISSTAYGQRLHDDMYESIFGSVPCYRRMNGTHQAGCSSKRGGSVGAVHAINNIADIDWLLTKSSARPYAALLPMSMFTADIFQRFIDNPDIIAGVLVINNGTDRLESFSQASRCPNEYYQGDSQQCDSSSNANSTWNPPGTGLSLMDIPFPVFYMPPQKKDSIISLYECFEKFNNFDLDQQSQRSLCAVEMNSFMFSAVNSEVCIRRSNMVLNLSPVRFCDPLADRSVYSTLFSRVPYILKNTDYDFSPGKVNVTTEKEIPPIKEGAGSVALVTAAMDSTSFFDATRIGAVGALSGLITLMATSQLLTRMFPATDNTVYDKNVMFVALNGETYDYIGSQRLAWDLLNGTFPAEGPYMSPKALGPHLHIGQISAHNSAPINAFTSKYDSDKRNNMVNDFVSWMTDDNGAAPTLRRAEGIPPSAAHTFLRMFNSSVSDMSSATLTDHGRNFNNEYYQSVLDDSINFAYTYQNVSFNRSLIGEGSYDFFPDSEIPIESIQMRLANLSTSIGRALYRHVTGKAYTGNLRASAYVIDELLHCYLDTASCDLLVAAQPSSVPRPPKETPPPALYVGVSVFISPASHTAAQIGALMAATPINRTKDACHGNETELVYYQWVAGWDGLGMCIRSNINLTDAKSPAFVEENYDYNSYKYSTWTESVWLSISLRILVQPSARQEAWTLGIGITVALLSAFIVPITKRHVVKLMTVESVPVPTGSGVDC